MNDIVRIKANYSFTPSDAENLKRLRPVMAKNVDEFVVEFYSYIRQFEDASRYLKDDATIKRHQDAMRVWFLRLFDGEYGEQYLSMMERVGMAHVKISLPAHFVNAAFHFVKSYGSSVIDDEVTDANERRFLMRSFEKILDINLDVFTSSYIEEERKVFLSHKVETYLIQVANRISHGLNIMVVIGLVIIGAIVIGLFGYDLAHIADGNIEKGLLSTLGSLLMLWVVIELLDTEIKHLKGGKFAIKVFVSVALVAVIRKVLVTSLKSDAVEAQFSLIAALAVLGVLYWLISKVET